MNLKTPSTMLDTLLNGSYQILLQHLIQENTKTNLKRKLPLNDVTFAAKARLMVETQPKSYTIPWKSKGRWNNCQIKSFFEFKAHSKYSLKDKWKIDLKKCIDSSPLLFVKGVKYLSCLVGILDCIHSCFSGEQEIVIGCSHAGLVVAVDVRWDRDTGTPSSCSEHSVMTVFCIQNRIEQLDAGITR